MYKYINIHKYNDRMLPSLLVNNGQLREFPGGPVVRTTHFHCSGPGFDP